MCVVFWAKCCGFFACMLVVVIPVRKTRPYFFLFLLRFDATTDCLLEGYVSNLLMKLLNQDSANNREFQQQVSCLL